MATVKPRRLALGPATIVALIASFGVLAFRNTAAPAEPPFPAPSAPKPPPLFKPEPRWLIDRASSLGLSADQTARLRALQTAWESDKRERLAAMGGSTGSVGQQGRRALPQIQADLRDYSELSRAYDVARTGYWLRAKATLRPDQLRRGGIL